MLNLHFPSDVFGLAFGLSHYPLQPTEICLYTPIFKVVAKLANASIYCDDIKRYMPVKRANPSLETIKEEWTQVVDSLLEDIKSGQALPNHVQDACKFCAYRSICRNSANEVEPMLRVEKEEE